MYPLTTTTERIDACGPCPERRDRAAQLLGITEPSKEPISYVELLDKLGLEDALWCCRAEPNLDAIWRRYAVWSARQVQHLMTDQRSLEALDVAERHAKGDATDAELAAAGDAAWAAARDAALAAAWAVVWAAEAAAGAAGAAAGDTARAAAGAAAKAAARAVARAAEDAARQQQAAAFRQLAECGTLPT